MIILILFVLLWTPYVVTELLRAQHARVPSSTQHRTPHAPQPSGPRTDTATQNGAAWSALDDRQLTRLLTDSAPRTTE